MLLGMIRSLGLQGSVLMTGEQRVVRDFYWAADIFVLPSRTEGLSIAMNEAMACGLPVIASNVGGAPDVVEQGKNGVLFQSEDGLGLTESLTTMLKIKETWPEMGARGRDIVKGYAEFDAVVERLNELYLELS